MDDILKVLAFEGRLIDPMRAQEQLRDGASVGQAEVMVSPYGVPDTSVPFGLGDQYVVDEGTFDALIEGYAARAEKNAIPFFLDHGYAHINPNQFTDSSMKIGKAVGLRSEGGLIADETWNLAKQNAREAFSDAVFDPYGTKFSYRWSTDDSYRGTDGKMHTRHIEDIKDILQLSISAAQQDTWVFPESVKMRTGVHHTGTTNEGGDIFIARTDLPPDLLRMAYAAMDIEGDPAVVSTYSFPHHIADNERIGMASVGACQQVIEDINKMRGISMEQRVAAYRHVVGHLKDTDVQVEPLRAAMPTLEEFKEMLADEGFKTDVFQVIGQPVGTTTVSGMGNVHTTMRAVAPAPTVPEWALAGAAMRGHLIAPRDTKQAGHAMTEDEARALADSDLQDHHWFSHFDDVGHSHPGMRTTGESIGALMKARMGDVARILLDDPDFYKAFNETLSQTDEERELASPATWYARHWDSR